MQAFVFSTCLDVSLEGGGVLPTPESRLENLEGTDHIIELFGGGFSGWSQVIRSLGGMEFPVALKLALDCDHDCVMAHLRTCGCSCIGPSLTVELDDDGCLPPHCVIEADVMEFGWVHLTGRSRREIGVASPPCPPWSKASLNPPGLRRRDGTLTPAAIAIMALCGCRVFCIENVAGLAQHPHWTLICEWLAFWKYDLRWVKCLDLSKVAPQKRERLLMIATKSGDEDLNSHICQSWPTEGQPSLQQFDVLTQVTGQFLHECTPSDSVLRMYLDPSNLPRGGQVARQTKKSRVDVAGYRLRSPQDQMSCLMANYSVGHELPNHTIQQGGLYGSLLALPSGLRFCSTPEMYLL